MTQSISYVQIAIFIAWGLAGLGYWRFDDWRPGGNNARRYAVLLLLPNAALAVVVPYEISSDIYAEV